MKKRLFAEELHTARDWLSPAQTPFNSGRHNPKDNAGDEEGPTPMPTKIQQIPLTFNVKNKQPTKNALVSNYDSNSDEVEDHERTPKPPSFTLQTKNAQVFSKVNDDQNQTPERKVPRAKTPTKKPAHDVPVWHLAEPNPTLEVTNSKAESHNQHKNTAKVSTTLAVDTNPTGSEKRKASDQDAIPKAPASKKGKAANVSFLSEFGTMLVSLSLLPALTICQTPARIFLTKNLETPVPASPLSKATCMTQSQVTQPPAASSKTLPPPPVALKSKAEVRKAAAQKAAATQRANKLAREAAKAMAESNESKERTKRKK
ncbi:hypothetical protein RHS03_06367, partial [Rhizoctonia solani]